MNKYAARLALTNAFQRMQRGDAVMVNPESMASMLQTAKALMDSEGGLPEDMNEESMTAMRDTLCQTYGYAASDHGKPFAFAEGTAIIPVHGSLINRFGGYYHGYATGYQFIRSQRAKAMVDPDVKRIIYDVNSPGGEAAGCFELADESFEMRGEKPTLAVVDSNCYSAAYAFASSADKISVTPTGGAGSIGVISMHADVSKLLDDFGVKITLITAGKHKADGNPFETLNEDVRKDIQADVDAFRDDFVALVARNRGLDEQAVRDTEARCYSAKDALALNLIDEVATPAKAVASFINGPSGSTIEGDEMSPEEQLQQTRNEAAAAERTRMQGITTSEHAAKNPKLAQHLAFNTGMSVEEANSIMAAAALDIPAQAQAPQTEPAAQTTQTAPQAQTNFEKAMAQTGGPGVGADTDANTAEMSDDDKAIAELQGGFAANGYIIDVK